VRVVLWLLKNSQQSGSEKKLLGLATKNLKKLQKSPKQHPDTYSVNQTQVTLLVPSPLLTFSSRQARLFFFKKNAK
jgi:hypothetical protein